MSDETPTPPSPRPAPEGYDSWPAYWTAQGMPWRTEAEVDEERQRYLAVRRAIKPDIERGIYPFKDIKLSRADVEWLLAMHDDGRGPVDWSDQKQLDREGVDLRGADLRRVDLGGLPLARLRGGLNFDEWVGATPEQREMAAAHLEGADLGRAHLEGADLGLAHLEGANLDSAHLEGANLTWAHLQGASLWGTHLEGATLRSARLDGKTDLAWVTLGEPRSALARLLRRKPKWGNASLGDIRWEGPPDLTQVRWDSLQRLGDEAGIGWRTPAISASSEQDHRDVVRAYRQVAAQLRAQGLSEEADRFAERAQIRRRQQTFRQMLEDWRRPWRLPGDLLRWLFSWVLAGLAGYGYHPERSVFWYLATIAGFAFAYYQVTRGFVPFGLPTQSSLAPLTWYEAAILSVSSFHGRGFFQPLQSLGDPVAALASIEAVIGLFIEISFIATFTQRFFGSR